MNKNAQPKARIRDYGICPGYLPCGPQNAITDVPGVKVGHWTLHNEMRHTGLTVILPREDIYQHKCTAASYVINGFGKTAGLVQIDELGQLETPIALTSTLNVGLISDALVQFTQEELAAKGRRLRSVNPVVGECNDASLNQPPAKREDRKTGLPDGKLPGCELPDGKLADPKLPDPERYHLPYPCRAAGYEEWKLALADARACSGMPMQQGCVGAGAGMTCHGLKGGIGSASRIVSIGGCSYTLGVLSLCSHGELEELMICGIPAGRRIAERMNGAKSEDRGSCILVLATDLPLSSRQLKRVCRRCAAGLARCGSFWGHGSGDIVIGFTTAHDIRDNEMQSILEYPVLREGAVDAAFAAAAEAAEESVLNALAAAVPVTGPDGTVRRALREFEDLLK